MSNKYFEISYIARNTVMFVNSMVSAHIMGHHQTNVTRTYEKNLYMIA